jgi:hypothetical protein
MDPIARTMTLETLELSGKVIKDIDCLRGEKSRQDFLWDVLMGIAQRRCEIVARVDYLPRKELFALDRHLVRFSKECIYLLSEPEPEIAPLPEPELRQVAITNMEVKKKILTGRNTPVYVEICNYGEEPEVVRIRLVDKTDRVFIGKRVLSIPPRSYETIHFDWKTKLFSLGDHILDARVHIIDWDGSEYQEPVDEPLELVDSKA